jgi:hypothetical protein
MANSKRRCAHCRDYFLQESMIKNNRGYYCGIDCMADAGLKKARAKKEKTARAVHAAKRRSLKDNDKRFQADKAQVIFNGFIRLRDYGHICISCQKPPKKKNAGHYLSRGAHPELRYHPLNCHLQCEHCNSFKSGNQVLYRINLINKIGVANVDWLEGSHAPKRYTIGNLKTIQKWYKRKTKRLEKANA